MPIPLGQGFRGPDGRVGYLLRQAHHAFRSAMEESLRDVGLTAAQYSILSIIEAEPGLSGSELAADAMLATQSTNEIVTALERAGHIERRRDARDGRIRRAHLTTSGRAVTDQGRRRVYALEERVMASLTERELRGFKAALVGCAMTLGSPAQPTA